MGVGEVALIMGLAVILSDSLVPVSLPRSAEKEDMVEI
jgi:hypothetical protein